MKKFPAVGVALSLLWIIILIALLCFKYESATKLGLNEWGDLLGGFMAPLALLWLVLGYLQQGEELRLNTEALKSQQEELRNQVRETADLVKESSRQAAAFEKMAEVAERQFKLIQSRELYNSLNSRR